MIMQQIHTARNKLWRKKVNASMQHRRTTFVAIHGNICNIETRFVVDVHHRFSITLGCSQQNKHQLEAFESTHATSNFMETNNMLKHRLRWIELDNDESSSPEPCWRRIWSTWTHSPYPWSSRARNHGGDWISSSRWGLQVVWRRSLPPRVLS